ncbi:hypothetical protein, partial [Kitasatospora sp. NPDC059571]|uniref:hypothetical protein n=1 Tax=Kitasatospora sp. NPDC059571 TaxID=3346871 RepID=UPI0036738282
MSVFQLEKPVAVEPAPVLTVVPEPPAEPVGARGRVAELHELRERVRRGPSEKATEAQHAKGKLTA